MVGVVGAVRPITLQDKDRDIIYANMVHTPSNQKSECKLWAPAYEMESETPPPPMSPQ